jgi:hypothetical protein
MRSAPQGMAADGRVHRLRRRRNSGRRRRRRRRCLGGGGGGGGIVRVLAGPAVPGARPVHVAEVELRVKHLPRKPQREYTV